MKITVLKSKIQEAIVSNSTASYNGSLTLDRDYMDKADLKPFEQIHVNNKTNGNRFITYILEAPRGCKKCEVNGAASSLCNKGDIIHILSYCTIDNDEKHNPLIVKEL